jgi:hypothetical protein
MRSSGRAPGCWLALVTRAAMDGSPAFKTSRCDKPPTNLHTRSESWQTRPTKRAALGPPPTPIPRTSAKKSSSAHSDSSPNPRRTIRLRPTDSTIAIAHPLTLRLKWRTLKDRESSENGSHRLPFFFSAPLKPRNETRSTRQGEGRSLHSPPHSIGRRQRPAKPRAFETKTMTPDRSYVYFQA